MNSAKTPDPFRINIETAIKAKTPAMLLPTHEERRVVAEIGVLCAERKMRLFVWSIASGLRERSASSESGEMIDIDSDLCDPDAVLRYIRNTAPADQRAVYVLADFHAYIDASPLTRRLLREVAQDIRSTNKEIIVLQPEDTLPLTLEKTLQVIDIPLPAYAELRSRLDSVISRLDGRKGYDIDLSEEERRALASAGLGLTRDEFDIAVTRAAVVLRGLNAEAIRLVSAEKRQIVRKSGLMEFFEPDATMADVGGLDLLKVWLRKRTRAFGDRARDFGLPSPKGLLTVGVPGCGKSLTAKAASALLGIPMIRLDVGALMGGIVGQSEANARRAIEVIETVAPCVLWLDEIEKGMAGMGSSDRSDGGTTARVMSTFLTWMNEKKSDVFIMATANGVESLPPELLRKGRFDEVFAVDVPSRQERIEILSIHLRKRKRDPSAFDLDAVATATEEFTGAELEQVVIESLFAAFDEDERDLTTADLVRAARETVPLVKTMPERVRALRQWAKTRARPASSDQATFLASIPDAKPGASRHSADDAVIPDDEDILA